LRDAQALAQVVCIVFDEFHGRSLASDLALAALRHRQVQQRLNVQLLVMSATLNAEPIAAFLGDAPIIEVMGRAHPVHITHQPHRDRRPVEQQVASAVAQALGQSATLPEADGDILVFLPGAAEIRRAQSACAALAQAHKLTIFALHGGLPQRAQDAAIRPCKTRKLILSTNVAETSVTIDGVSWVVDTGLAKQASQEPWSGVSRLDLQPISQAAATQRAGRAGRTRPGYCLRLYTANEMMRRPQQAPPEVMRLDLAEAQLWLADLGLPPLGALACLDAPPAEHSAAATALLARLGAISTPKAHGHAAPNDVAPLPLTLTAVGRALAQWPLHPRLGRLLYEAASLGIEALGARACALLSDTAVLHELLGQPRPQELADSDLALWLDDSARWPEPTRMMARRLEEQARRLRRQINPQVNTVSRQAQQSLLSRALWTGFVDRIARRMPPHGVVAGALPLQLASGGKAHLSAQSQVRDSVFIIALYAQAQTHSTQTQRIVQIAESVSAELLLELGGDAIVDASEVRYNPQTQRVDVLCQLSYDGLILEESRSTADAAQAGPVLFGVAQAMLKSRGWAAFLDVEALGTLRARLQIAAQYSAVCRDVVLDDATLLHCLEQICQLCTSFAEVAAHSVLDSFYKALAAPVQAALLRLTPLRVRLVGGRDLPICYAPQKPPFISAHLQDFFGSAQGPAIADKNIFLTLHLLAPNKRPVQITQDLSGFWARHYPALKKQLSRRYPRHAWPDDPIHAAPPPPHKPRRKPA
jgi:ATP-dependent helicase HrpB